MRPVFALAVSLALASSAVADEKLVEIPLKDVWALDMPGTRSIRELDPPRKSEPQTVREFIDSSLVERTAQTLNPHNWPKDHGNPGRGFVVVGTETDALREAYAVLSKEKKRADFLPTDKELTLVFYSYSSGKYVHLDKVELRGDTITVAYRFVSHRTLDMSPHVALIPLGKLPTGKVRVRIEQVPDSNSKTLENPARPIVCDSFSFAVR